jgi:hypothetical protein
MGVAQLAIAYCDNLVEDAGARSAFFTRGFNFNDNVYDAFAGDEQVNIIDDLYDRMIGIPRGVTDLGEVPTRVEVRAELNSSPDGLYDRLRSNGCSGSKPATVPAACNAVRTRAIVKALCASTLGSAAMLVQ